MKTPTTINASPLPSAEEIALAKLGSQTLSALLNVQGDVQEISVLGTDGEYHHIALPANAVKMMIEVLTQLGQGNSINITPIHAELTTQEAADLLNMSRPTLIKLLDTQAIPYTRKGNRRKVAFADVMLYKELIDSQRLQALDELTALDQELGLGY